MAVFLVPTLSCVDTSFGKDEPSKICRASGSEIASSLWFNKSQRTESNTRCDGKRDTKWIAIAAFSSHAMGSKEHIFSYKVRKSFSSGQYLPTSVNERPRLLASRGKSHTINLACSDARRACNKSCFAMRGRKVASLLPTCAICCKARATSAMI